MNSPGDTHPFQETILRIWFSFMDNIVCSSFPTLLIEMSCKPLSLRSRRDGWIMWENRLQVVTPVQE